MYSFKERFSPTTTSIGSDSYLVLKLSEEEEIERFQVEMIANNHIPGILPIDIRQSDNNINLYYNVTSKQPLPLIFSRKKFSRNEFITFLYNVTNAMDDCKNFLLSNNRFVLDENYIYVDPSTLETSLIYLPIQMDNDVNQGIKNFINRLIIEIANLEEKQTDNYLQRIINFLRNDTINLVEFKIFLNELKGIKKESKPEIVSKPIENKVQQAIDKPVVESNIQRENVNEVKQPKEESVPNRGIPRADIPKAKSNKNISKKPGKKKEKVVREKSASISKATKIGYKTSTIILGILSQVIIIAVIIGFWDKLKGAGNDIVTTLAGIAIVVGGIDYFIFKNLLNKDNMIEKSSKTTKDRKVNKVKGPKKRPNIPVEKPIDMNKREVRNVEQFQSNNEAIPQRKMAYNEPEISYEDYNVDETTFIGDIISERRALLQGKRNGLIEEINITKDSFIIGRIKDQVDYVTDNKTIGKMHAEIVTRDNKYYIKDLNSRNGTFLNSERLVGYQEYPLSNNDEVVFSNSNFVFIVLE